MLPFFHYKWTKQRRKTGVGNEVWRKEEARIPLALFSLHFTSFLTQHYTFISCCKRAKLIIKQSVRSLPLFIINLTLWKQRNSGRLDRRLGSFSSLLTWLICNEMKRKREISQWKKRREITEPHQPQILGGCNGWMLSEEQEGRDKVSEVHAFSSLLLLHFSFHCCSSLCLCLLLNEKRASLSSLPFHWTKAKGQREQQYNLPLILYLTLMVW